MSAASGAANVAQEKEDSEVDQIAIHEETLQPDPQQLQRAIADLSSPDQGVVAAALRVLRPILEEGSDSGRQCIIDCGGVLPLVALMRSAHDPDTQYEAAWALTLIASGLTEQTQAVVDAGAIPAFVRLLASSNNDVARQAAFGVGRISGASPSLRDECLGACALDALHSLLLDSSRPLALRCTAGGTLCKLVGGSPPPTWSRVQRCVAVCADLLASEDVPDDLLSSLALTLSLVSDSSLHIELAGPERTAPLDALISHGCIQHLLPLLSHASVHVRLPAIRVLGNIASGEASHTRALVRSGALPLIGPLLSDEHASVRREAGWTLSNCADYLDALVHSDAIPPLVQACCEDSHPHVRFECAWALCNAAEQANERVQRAQLLSDGTLRALVHALGAEWEPEKAEALRRAAAENLLRLFCRTVAEHEGDRESQRAAVQPFVDAAREAGIDATIQTLLQRSSAGAQDEAVSRTNARVDTLSRFLNGEWAADAEDEDESEDEDEESEEEMEESDSEESESDSEAAVA